MINIPKSDSFVNFNHIVFQILFKKKKSEPKRKLNSDFLCIPTKILNYFSIIIFFNRTVSPLCNFAK